MPFAKKPNNLHKFSFVFRKKKSVDWPANADRCMASGRLVKKDFPGNPQPQLPAEVFIPVHPSGPFRSLSEMHRPLSRRSPPPGSE